MRSDVSLLSGTRGAEWGGGREIERDDTWGHCSLVLALSALFSMCLPRRLRPLGSTRFRLDTAANAGPARPSRQLAKGGTIYLCACQERERENDTSLRKKEKKRGEEGSGNERKRREGRETKRASPPKTHTRAPVPPITRRET